MTRCGWNHEKGWGNQTFDTQLHLSHTYAVRKALDNTFLNLTCVENWCSTATLSLSRHNFFFSILADIPERQSFACWVEKEQRRDIWNGTFSFMIELEIYGLKGRHTERKKVRKRICRISSSAKWTLNFSQRVWRRSTKPLLRLSPAWLACQTVIFYFHVYLQIPKAKKMDLCRAYLFFHGPSCSGDIKRMTNCSFAFSYSVPTRTSLSPTKSLMTSHPLGPDELY